MENLNKCIQTYSQMQGEIPPYITKKLCYKIYKIALKNIQKCIEIIQNCIKKYTKLYRKLYKTVSKIIQNCNKKYTKLYPKMLFKQLRGDTFLDTKLQ